LNFYENNLVDALLYNKDNDVLTFNYSITGKTYDYSVNSSGLVFTNSIRIDSNLNILSKGSNFSNILGLNDISHTDKEIMVDSSGNWERVYMFNGFTLAKKKDGSVYTWGENVFFSCCFDVKYFMTPTKISNKKYKQILSSNSNNLSNNVYKFDNIYLLTLEGEIECYNNNFSGVKKYDNIVSIKGWEKISSFKDGLVALKNKNIYSITKRYSLNNLSRNKNSDNPYEVKEIYSSKKIVDFQSSNKAFSKSILFISDSAHLYGMGDNSSGQLGISNNRLNNEYKDLILIDSTKKWKRIWFLDNNKSLLLTKENELFISGEIRIVYDTKDVPKDYNFKLTKLLLKEEWLFR
jgi:alpha-tubulin suppressor-like RCC1 family protein